MIYFGEKSWRPTWEFDGKTFVSAVRYGIYQLGSQTINQLRTQADALIVGKVMGAEMLGIYSLAKELILQPLKLVSPVINRRAAALRREAARSRAAENCSSKALSSSCCSAARCTLRLVFSLR